MYDVLVIGGGISGSSIFYELCKYKLKVALLEKENDVSLGSTKANSGIIHAGYDPAPGTLMARYNVEGNKILHKRCKNLSVGYKHTGSLVLAFNNTERETLEQLYGRGQKNNVPNLKIIEQNELRELEANISTEAVCALKAGTAAVFAPWELALAQAQAGVEAGGEAFLNCEVTSISKKTDCFEVETTQGLLKSRYIVNAAGLYADKIAKMAGGEEFNIMPKRGEYYLLDTTMGKIVNHVIFQCPTKEGKGVLISPTAHNTLIVGPSAEDSNERDDVQTTTAALARVRELAIKSVPSVNFGQSIRNFAGLRAISNVDDFIVGEDKKQPNLFNAAGIKSPGLTAAPAIARDIVKMLEKKGLELKINPAFSNKRKYVVFANLSKNEKEQIIKENPLYGNIVCRCFTVSEGEITDVLRRPLPPVSLDGVKRRTGAGMGRCQSGFCGPKVQQIIARELNMNPEDITLDAKGSFITLVDS